MYSMYVNAYGLTIQSCISVYTGSYTLGAYFTKLIEHLLSIWARHNQFRMLWSAYPIEVLYP